MRFKLAQKTTIYKKKMKRLDVVRTVDDKINQKGTTWNHQLQEKKWIVFINLFVLIQ